MSSATVAPQLAGAEQTGISPSLRHSCLSSGGLAFITASLPGVTFDLWIGLHASQRDFQWIEQEPLLYANWAPGEPSGPSPAPSGTKPVRTLFSFLCPCDLWRCPLPCLPHLPAPATLPWGSGIKSTGISLSSPFPPDQLCGGPAQPLSPLHRPLG